MSSLFVFAASLATAGCMQGPVDLGLPALNSEESEVSIALSAQLDEAWIERRSGAWGEPGGSSRLLEARRDPAAASWSRPEPAPFAESHSSEGDPFFDDASQTLYFASTRPHPTLPAGTQNIWKARRDSGVWEPPEPLPAPINGHGDEYSPILRNGKLYFASTRNGNGDLFVATARADGWNAESLGPAFNSSGGEWNLWVAPSDDLVLFEASNRPGNVSVSGDIYASVRDASGDWLPAVALSEVNGTGSDLNAMIACNMLVWASTSEHAAHADFYSAAVDVRSRVLDAYDHTLHIVNRSSHEVAAVELSSGRTLSSTSIGPGPHLVATASDALAVPAYGVFPRPHLEPVAEMPPWIEAPGGNLLVVGDPDNNAQLRRYPLPCTRPHGVAWDDTGSRLWVTCEDQQAILEITPGSTQERHRLLATGYAGAHVVVWDSAHEQVLVAHTDAGGVAFLQPDSGMATFLRLSPGAEALWIDYSRAQGWVSLGPSGQLAVVDLAEHSELARIQPDCAFPIDFAAAGEVLWVACFGSHELVGLTLATREVSARIKLPAGPLNIEAHPDLPVLYASLPRQNRVVEVSITTGEVTRSFATGIEPDGLVIRSGERPKAS